MLTAPTASPDADIKRHAPNVGASPEQRCVYVELAARTPNGRMIRNQFVRRDDVAAIAQWRAQYANRDVYTSICRFDRAGRSQHYMVDCFVDIDAKDLGVARKEALRVCALLEQRLDIPPSAIDLAFSGAKGFHLLVPREVFGQPVSPRCLYIWSLLARRLSKECAAHIDLGVYQASRLWRLANSINSKSGLHKVPLEYEELRDLGIDHVLEVARCPREESALNQSQESPKAVRWFHEVSERLATRGVRPLSPTEATGGRDRGWRTPPCVRRVEQTVLPDGCRHSVYFALACFYASTGMAKIEAVERLRAIDDGHPIRDRDYLERAVHNAWHYPGFQRCPNGALQLYCEPAGCFLARGNPRTTVEPPRQLVRTTFSEQRRAGEFCGNENAAEGLEASV